MQQVLLHGWDLPEMGTRRKVHHNKVHPTKEDLDTGNIESANTRMNANDEGLAKHTSTGTEEIDWENTKIVGREQKWTQRKYLDQANNNRRVHCISIFWKKLASFLIIIVLVF